MAGVLTQVKAIVRIALYLAIAYVAIKFWQDPAGSASALVNLIGGIGNFFATLLDKVGAFVQGLGR